MFWKLFGDSWNDYWRNFGAILSLMLLFYLLPSIIFNYYLFSNLDVFSWNMIFIGGILLVGLVLLSFVYTTALMSSSVKRKKFGFKTSLQDMKGNYWRFIGFSIVLALCLFGLFILLIIPGIIFIVYWTFAPYIFLNEKKGIRESMKTSKQMIRGRWWKTLGYVLLFSILLIIPMILYQIIMGLIVPAFNEPTSVIGLLTSQILNAIPQIIFGPLYLLFLKNYYLALKSVPQKQKSRK